MRNRDETLSLLVTISILALLQRVTDSANLRLELRAGPESESVAENTGLKFTCAAQRSAGEAKDWNYMEVEVAPAKGKEALCYKDCVDSFSGEVCEEFLVSTVISCPHGSCSENAVNKTCHFELRRVLLDVNYTTLRCAMGSSRSNPLVLNVKVPTRIKSLEAKTSPKLEVINKARSSITVYESSIEHVTFECTVRTTDIKEVVWSRATQSSGSEAIVWRDTKPSVGGPYTWVSRLKLNATRNNSGTYRCNVEESENNTISAEMRLQVYYGRLNVPRVQSLETEYVVGEKIVIECEVGDSLPAATLFWDYFNPTENKWIEASKNDTFLKPSIEAQVFKGEWGGQIVSSQLGIKLTSALFDFKFRCVAAHYDKIEYISPAITINKIALKRSLVIREELSSGGVTRDMAVDCEMRLAKCAAIDCRVRDLLLGLSRAFCTPDAVRDVTAGLLTEPAALFRALDSAKTLELNAKKAVLKAKLEIGADQYTSNIRLNTSSLPESIALQILMLKSLEQESFIQRELQIFKENTQCGNWTFDRNRSYSYLKHSPNSKTIEGYGGNWFGAYLYGQAGAYLPTSGKTAFCMRATAGPGGNSLHVMVGLAVEGVNLNSYTESKEFLVYLYNGDRYGGAADVTYHGISGGASPGDMIRVLYNADANTIMYFRNGNPYSKPIPLNANALNEKSRLRFYVVLLYSGQYVTVN